MREGDRYSKVVEWSDVDQCFIGSCPELFYGGCHGSEARAVFEELCSVVDEVVALYHRDRKPLPAPLTDREFVNGMLKLA